MRNALSLEQVRRLAPSVFATTPWCEVSDSYRFVPTIEVLDAMLAKGWQVVQAGQARTRIPGKGDFTKHVLRMQHPDMPRVGDSVSELALMNAHDRTSAYKLYSGVFRFICLNGLIACSEKYDAIVTRHSGRGNLVQEVIEGSYRIIENAPKVHAQITDWRGMELNRAQQVAYANAASELRDVTVKASPEQLIESWRAEDKAATVWNTFNVVQENLIRGGQGVIVRNETTGRRSYRHTRAIKSVNEDAKLNRALWRLTEELAKVAA